MPLTALSDQVWNINVFDFENLAHFYSGKTFRSELLEFKTLKNENIFHIIDQVKVSRVLDKGFKGHLKFEKIVARTVCNATFNI